MKESEWAYLGRLSCSCVVAVCVDAPDDRAGTARELARWVREGRHVERVTVETARTTKLGCDCKPKPAAVEPSEQGTLL